ncbi:MAG: phytanoyl-CoA dioxygenase family protein [Gammaproteobacteria bacterium]|nr:phytanoyl-CoA dioxygenase family protein [Gammaproteobacteria bacterium]
MDEHTEMNRYLYDLQGYLVIENVLTSTEVAGLNAAIDAQIDPIPTDWRDTANNNKLGMYKIYRFGMAGGSYPSGPGFLVWGELFCRLIDHPAVMDIMRFQLGDCFRLDRIFGMRMAKGMPSGMLHSDYGASAPFTHAERGRYFPQPVHQALHGFGVAAFNLTDSGPETGGLRVIPGSHHSHFKLPKKVRRDEHTDIVACPEAPAGSVTLFSEATTHGTAAWTASHERRSLLYKYCASNLTWSRTRVTAPEDVDLRTRQRRLLEEPAGGGWFFSSIFEADEELQQGSKK